MVEKTNRNSFKTLSSIVFNRLYIHQSGKHIIKQVHQTLESEKICLLSHHGNQPSHRTWKTMKHVFIRRIDAKNVEDGAVASPSTFHSGHLSTGNESTKTNPRCVTLIRFTKIASLCFVVRLSVHWNSYMLNLLYPSGQSFLVSALASSSFFARLACFIWYFCSLLNWQSNFIAVFVWPKIDVKEMQCWTSFFEHM